MDLVNFTFGEGLVAKPSYDSHLKLYDLTYQ